MKNNKQNSTQKSFFTQGWQQLSSIRKILVIGSGLFVIAVLALLAFNYAKPSIQTRLLTDDVKVDLQRTADSDQMVKLQLITKSQARDEDDMTDRGPHDVGLAFMIVDKDSNIVFDDGKVYGTDESGKTNVIDLPGVDPGSYSIWIKLECHLSQREDGIPLQLGVNIVEFKAPFIAGDNGGSIPNSEVCGDNIINTVDLNSYYNRWGSKGDFNEDTNGDSEVGAEDYSQGLSSIMETGDSVLATNEAPIVEAGDDQNITLPSSATLSGTVTDDGLPDPPATVITTWSQVSGPGTVTFDDDKAINTSAYFPIDGTYVLKLEADDSELTGSDTLTIIVNPESIPPTGCSVPLNRTFVGAYVSLDQRENYPQDLTTMFVLLQDMDNPPPPGEEASYACDATVSINNIVLALSPYGSFYTKDNISLNVGETYELKIDLMKDGTTDISGQVVLSKIDNLSVNNNPTVPEATITWSDQGTVQETTYGFILSDYPDPGIQPQPIPPPQYSFGEVTGDTTIKFGPGENQYFPASQYYGSMYTKTQGSLTVPNGYFEATWISKQPLFSY